MSFNGNINEITNYSQMFARSVKQKENRYPYLVPSMGDSFQLQHYKENAYLCTNTSEIVVVLHTRIKYKNKSRENMFF